MFYILQQPDAELLRFSQVFEAILTIVPPQVFQLVSA